MHRHSKRRDLRVASYAFPRGACAGTGPRARKGRPFRDLSHPTLASPALEYRHSTWAIDSLHTLKAEK